MSPNPKIAIAERSIAASTISNPPSKKGRPPHAVKRDIKYEFKLSERERQQLEELANHQGVCAAEVIRQLLHREFNRYEAHLIAIAHQV